MYTSDVTCCFIKKRMEGVKRSHQCVFPTEPTVIEDGSEATRGCKVRRRMTRMCPGYSFWIRLAHGAFLDFLRVSMLRS